MEPVTVIAVVAVALLVQYYVVKGAVVEALEEIERRRLEREHGVRRPLELRRTSYRPPASSDPPPPQPATGDRDDG